MFHFNWRFLFLLTYHVTKERDCRDSCKKDRALEHQNVHLGSIEFRDSDFGSCIAGIYGQNGSGKTAVVDAFSCLKLLMCGLSLPAGAEGLPKRALIAYGLGDTGKDFALAPEIR